MKITAKTTAKALKKELVRLLDGLLTSDQITVEKMTEEQAGWFLHYSSDDSRHDSCTRKQTTFIVKFHAWQETAMELVAEAVQFSSKVDLFCHCNYDTGYAGIQQLSPANRKDPQEWFGIRVQFNTREQVMNRCRAVWRQVGHTKMFVVLDKESAAGFDFDIETA